MTPRSSAEATVVGVCCRRPVTVQPCVSASASATDAPISPRPTTWAWRLFGEVITQALGVSKVHVSKFASRPGGVDVDQNPDAHRHRAGHVDLAGAEQRDVAEADAARHRRRKGRREVAASW